MRTKAIIHIKRFVNNLQALRALVGNDRKICVPVKADAYGHGAVQIAKAAVEAGAFCFGVASVEEGCELRNEGIKAPVLLMSQPHFDEIPAMVAANLTPFVSDAGFIDALNEYASNGQDKLRLSVHLKIDTGMGRFGCAVEDALELARRISQSASLELAGTLTHFATADSSARADMEYTYLQTARFKEAVGVIRSAGINPGIVHAANSGAALLHPDTWFDMVRPGIFLYGYNPMGLHPAENALQGLKAEPVMELKSPVILIKKIKRGESVSYGRTWIASQDTNIAILPLGYADGLPRLASNKWQVIIGGSVYSLIGNICMDHCCVDLGLQSPVRRWDEATVFGSDTADSQAFDAAELARRIGMIPYEITCNINKRVPRVYIDSKK